MKDAAGMLIGAFVTQLCKGPERLYVVGSIKGHEELGDDTNHWREDSIESHVNTANSRDGELTVDGGWEKTGGCATDADGKSPRVTLWLHHQFYN